MAGGAPRGVPWWTEAVGVGVPTETHADRRDAADARQTQETHKAQHPRSTYAAAVVRDVLRGKMADGLVVPPLGSAGPWMGAAGEGEDDDAVPLPWEIPLGVLHDALAPRDANDDADADDGEEVRPIRSGESPWALRFRPLAPPKALPAYPASLAAEDSVEALAPTRIAFFMALKEACFCTTGGTQAVARMPLAKQDAAFRAALAGDAEACEDALSEVADAMRAGAWARKRVPLRIVGRAAAEDGAGARSVVVSRAAPVGDVDALVGVRAAAKGAVRDSDLRVDDDAELVIAGVVVNGEELSVWHAWECLRSVDGFLYVAVRSAPGR